MQADLKSSIPKTTADMDYVYNELLEELLKNRQIIQTLDFGLFLLAANFNIQDNYSLVFEEIINQKNLVDQNFIKLLENKVPENIVSDTREYLNFMFQEDLGEKTINELNPLASVEFHFEDQWGLWTTSKHLSFKFKRIVEDAKIDRLVCTVKDISEEIAKKNQLKKAGENLTKQMEWLVNILHVEPELLQEFVSVIENELNLIDDALKNPKNMGDYSAILKTINRAVSNINTNASFLDLKFFTNKSQQFKQAVVKIANNSNLNGSDFVSVVVQSGEMRQMLNEVKTLTQKLKHFEGSLRTTRRYECDLLIKNIESTIQKLCQKLGKQVQFNHQSFDSFSIPYSNQQLVKEFLIVLARYTVLYSIEKPDERKSVNKDPTGTIEIETLSSNRIIGFKFRHDGQLIRIERFLEKTLESSYTDKYDSPIGSQVIKMLFTPNVSPSSLNEAEWSKDVFNDMNLVKKKLKMHGGKIKITFTTENFCEYTISLPRKNEKRV